MTEEAAAPEAAPEAEAAPAEPEITLDSLRSEHTVKTARLEAALRKAERSGHESKSRMGDLQKSADELATWKGDKWAAAKSLGITFDEMSQRVLDGEDNPSPEDIQRREDRAEVAALKSQLEEERTIREQRDTAAGFEDDVQQIASILPEGSLAKETGQERVIAQMLHNEFERTGEVPDVQELIELHEKLTSETMLAQLKSKAGIALILGNDDLKSAILAALNGTADGDIGKGEDGKRNDDKPQATGGDGIDHKLEDVQRVVTNSTSAETGGRGGRDEGDLSNLSDAERNDRALAKWREIKAARKRAS